MKKRILKGQEGSQNSHITMFGLGAKSAEEKRKKRNCGNEKPRENSKKKKGGKNWGKKRICGKKKNRKAKVKGKHPTNPSSSQRGLSAKKTGGFQRTAAKLLPRSRAKAKKPIESASKVPHRGLVNIQPKKGMQNTKAKFHKRGQKQNTLGNKRTPVPQKSRKKKKGLFGTVVQKGKKMGKRRVLRKSPRASKRASKHPQRPKSKKLHHRKMAHKKMRKKNPKK